MPGSAPRTVITAAMFLARHKQFAQYTMRFDVLALSGARPIEVHWIRDAFRPGDSTF